MLVNPSLRDVLSPDLWIPGRTVWPGVRRSPNDANQSILVVAVALRHSIDRSAAPDAHGCSSAPSCQPRLLAPNVVQPCSKDDHSACNAPVHQTCRCCHHMASWSSAKQRGRFPPPEPTCLPQRFHGKLECTLRLVLGSDDCRADRALAESCALGRSQSPSPVTLSQVHLRVTQRQCVSTFPTTVSTDPHQWKDHKQPTQAIEHPVLDHS